MRLQRFQLSFNLKLLLIYLVVIVVSSFLVVHALFTLYQSLLDDRRNHIRHLVENNITLLEHYHTRSETGQITKSEAQQQALGAIRRLRYENSGYFWVNDLNTRVLAHPIFPDLEGKQLLDYRDSRGQLIFRNFVTIAQTSGSGHLYYFWPKPTGDTPVEKLAYIELYEPWGWILGSGTYLDDIQTIFWSKAKEYVATLISLLIIISGLVWSILRVDAQAFHYNKLMATALESCADAIIITDHDTRIIWTNSAYERLTGYKLEDIKGKTPADINHSGQQTNAFYQKMWQSLQRGEYWSGELINRHRSGHFYYVHMTVTPVLNKSGHTVNYIAVKRDISDRKQAQLELEERASTDSLTHMPNRRTFIEHLDTVLARQHSNKGVLLMMDLDHFKNINDEYGHLCGDQVLIDFAELLQSSLKEGEQIGRLGGEEFALLGPHLSPEQGKKRADDIRRQLDKHYTHYEGKKLRISVSIGLTSIQPEDISSSRVIDRADQALYKAKDAGRNCVRYL